MHSILVAVVLLLSQSRAEDEFPGLAKLVMPPATHTRVVGGHQTTIGELGGYLVALRYDNKFICGGTLIESTIILSAAHCFMGRLNKDRWIAHGGISLLNEAGGVRMAVKDYIMSADFKEDTMNMDVAVLKLVKPLEGPNIATAKLCSTHLAEGAMLTVSGWGMTDPLAASPHQTVRTVSVPILKKSTCKKTYQASIVITNSMFCAGVLGEKDACTFDSGGPLILDTPNNGKEVCGIVSFGISCASPKFPGVYTDVPYVKPFILKAIESLSS